MHARTCKVSLDFYLYAKFILLFLLIFSLLFLDKGSRRMSNLQANMDSTPYTCTEMQSDRLSNTPMYGDSRENAGIAKATASYGRSSKVGNEPALSYGLGRILSPLSFLIKIIILQIQIKFNVIHMYSSFHFVVSQKDRHFCKKASEEWYRTIFCPRILRQH
jgi:hypothetical protein